MSEQVKHHDTRILPMTCLVAANLARYKLTLPAPRISQCWIKIQINLNFYFHASLWCLKRFYEDLQGLHKIFCGTTKKFENMSRIGAERVKVRRKLSVSCQCLVKLLYLCWFLSGHRIHPTFSRAVTPYQYWIWTGKTLPGNSWIRDYFFFLIKNK